MLVRETQKRLRLWATEYPNEKRRELYNLRYHDTWIRQAHDNVKQNAGSLTAGCDGITMKRFDENLEENLQVLQDELKAKTFEAYPVRRVYLPKSPNKWRP